MPESQGQPILAERIEKASAYFLEQITLIAEKVLPLMQVGVDNKEIAKRLADTADHFNNAYRLKEILLKLVRDNGFDIPSYQRCKVDFALQKPKKAKAKKVEEVYSDNQHPKLVKLLTKWRTSLAKEEGLPAYTILTQKSLLAIADSLPRDGKALLRIPGIGAAKAKRFGADIIQIVEDYCHDLEHPKEPAFQQAAHLFAEGKSIEDVAGAMLRATSTVEGYLYTAVEKGILDPDLILAPEQQDEILTYLPQAPLRTLRRQVQLPTAAHRTTLLARLIGQSPSNSALPSR